MFKRLFCIQLICLIMLLTTVSFYYCEPIIVYADDAGLGDYLDFLNQFETFWKAAASDDMPWPMVRDAFYSCLTYDMGFVTSTVWINQADLLRKGLIKVHEKRYGVDNVKSDDQKIKEITQDFKQNISVNNNFTSHTYNNDSRQILIDLSDFIMSQSPSYYIYSTDIRDSVLQWQNGVEYNKIKRFIEQYQNDYYVGFQYWDVYRINIVPKHGNNLRLVENHIDTNNGLSVADWYDFITWQKLTTPNYPPYNLSFNVPGLKVFQAKWVDADFVIEEQTDFYSGSNYYMGTFDPSIDIPTCPGQKRGYWEKAWYTSGQTQSTLVYRTLADMKLSSAGQSPYYITNTWNDFSRSTTNYTIDNSNYNPVTYNEIINHNETIYNQTGEYPTIDEIIKWIEERRNPDPTPTPTPTPGPDNPLIDPDDPTPTPTPTPGPDDYDPWRHTVSGNGTGGDTDDWSFWDFLKGIINFLKGIVEGIGSILSAITDWFTVDTDLIKTHVSGVIDGSVPLPNGVSYNGIVNEIIPVDDIKSIGKAFTDIPDGFVPGTYYPKLTIKTPQIIRQFYDEEEIVLLDFEEWASTFVIVRTLLEFSFWLAEIYYLLSKLRPVISIS